MDNDDHATSRVLMSSKNSLSSQATAITADPPPPVYSEMAIILACLICALICVVGLMAVARCTWLRHLLLHGHQPSTAPSAALKRKVVESLPRLIFKSSGGGSKAEAAECVICLGEFANGEEIRVLPGCSHVFHVACIDRWLLGSHSSCCPSCRQVLVADKCQKCSKGINVISSQTQLEADFLP